MPTPQQSRGVDTTRLFRRQPGPIATPIVSQLPVHLMQSPVMISSLPSISTVVDGITRQFYGARQLPTRRGYLP